MMVSQHVLEKQTVVLPDGLGLLIGRQSLILVPAKVRGIQPRRVQLVHLQPIMLKY